MFHTFLRVFHLMFTVYHSRGTLLLGLMVYFF